MRGLMLMNVVFTGWWPQLKTVSLLDLIRQKTGASLLEGKRMLDALVAIPVVRLELPDCELAAKMAGELSSSGLPSFARGATLMLSGWQPEAEPRDVVEVIARHAAQLRPQIAEFVATAAAGPVVEVSCPSHSSAQELVFGARALGVVCGTSPS